MADQEIYDDLTNILRELLDKDDIVLTAQTRRDNIPKWDSLNYVNFIIAVEMKYKIRFPVSQVEGFENIGEIVEAVKERRKK